MKKKDYQKPTMKVVKLQHRSNILTSSPYSTPGGTDLNSMDEEEDL